MKEIREKFGKSINELAEAYKDNPAKMEAMATTAIAAFEAFGDIEGLSGTIGKSKVSTAVHERPAYNGVGATDQLSPKPNARALAGAMTLVRKWAKSDPVGCQQWINKTLKKDIENAASTMFSNTSDNWRKAFKDEVSGQADIDREKINEDLKSQAAKEAAKADKAAKVAGAKEAKNAEKAFWDNQKALGKEAKKQAHRDALAKMDEEDKQYADNRAVLEKYGRDPEMYADTKKRGVFNKLGRGIKRMWHKLNEAAEKAMAEGDVAKLESIKAQMVEFKTLFEAAGVDIDEAILG